MSDRFRGYRRLVIEWLAITLLLAGFAATASMRGWLTPLDDLVFDLAISATHRSVPQDIVLIGIDDESIAQLGKWPWRRDLHAALIDILARSGARAIALDILLTEAAPDPRADLVLAEAMRRSQRVVLPLIREYRPDGIWHELTPIAQLAQAAAGLGHIEASVDADGVMRGYHRFAGERLAPHPHLALGVLSVATRTHGLPAPVVIGPATESAGMPPSGWKQSQFRRIPFLAPAGSFTSVSYADVLKGKVSADIFKDRIVLVGAFATGMGDAYSVPATRGRGPMPGVEIIANIIEGERSNRSIGAIAPIPAGILSILLPLLVMLLLPRLRNWMGILLVSAALLAALAVAVGMPQFFRTWWPPAGSLIALLLAYPLWSWRCLDAAQALIDEELARISVQAGRDTQPPARRSLIDRMMRIRALRTRLDTAQDQREQALRFISHDMRAPLASLITLMESVADKYRADPARPWLASMRRYADRALAMADDFLRLARAEAISEQNFAPCCLLAIVDEAIDEFWPQAHAKRVTIFREFAVSDSEAPMQGEAGLLRRAFANLLSNAIRHTPSGSTIRVGLKPDGRHWVVTVADQGQGIADEDLSKLFGRHPQIQDATPAGTEGTGLGLLIVRTVIERHGGSVGVSSEVGAGTIFTVSLPGQYE